MITYLIAIFILAVSGAAHAEQLACTKIGFPLGTPDPNKCFAIADDATPITPAPVAAASASSNAQSNATAQQSLESKSLSLGFPAPATTSVPMAQNCIVTKSQATSLALGVISHSDSIQFSDPVCVLMWAYHVVPVDNSPAILEAIFRRLGESGPQAVIKKSAND